VTTGQFIDMGNIGHKTQNTPTPIKKQKTAQKTKDNPGTYTFLPNNNLY